MVLKNIVSQKILGLLADVQKQPGTAAGWRVLIVDGLSMRMVSACCKMHDLAEHGITIVEDIFKRREPLQDMEAVYLIEPCESSVQALVKDYSTPGRALYKAAHVFFTEGCPDTYFNMLVTANIAKYVKTLKEVNIAFLPQESQVRCKARESAIRCLDASVCRVLVSKTLTLERGLQQPSSRVRYQHMHARNTCLFLFFESTNA